MKLLRLVGLTCLVELMCLTRMPPGAVDGRILDEAVTTSRFPEKDPAGWLGAMEGAHGAFQRFADAKSEQDLVGLLDDRASAEFSIVIIANCYWLLHVDEYQRDRGAAIVNHPQITRRCVDLLEQYGMKPSWRAVTRCRKYTVQQN